MSRNAIEHRIATGRLLVVEQGVFAVAPVLQHDQWGKWMGATLTAPGSVLSHKSAAAAWSLWSFERTGETVTRRGNGGPRRHGGVFVHRSTTLGGESTVLRGIPITTVPRTLVDLSGQLGDRALARAVREAMRLKLATVDEVHDYLKHTRGRRGTRRLALVLERYAGLPLERARSGAEIRALELLRAAERPSPRLNFKVAGEEADLSWPDLKLIVEIDGRPFHLDRGEDARKQAAWRAAGWTVRRVSSEDVYEHPHRLLSAVPRHRTSPVAPHSQ